MIWIGWWRKTYQISFPSLYLLKQEDTVCLCSIFQTFPKLSWGFRRKTPCLNDAKVFKITYTVSIFMIAHYYVWVKLIILNWVPLYFLFILGIIFESYSSFSPLFNFTNRTFRSLFQRYQHFYRYRSSEKIGPLLVQDAKKKICPITSYF